MESEGCSTCVAFWSFLLFLSRLRQNEAQGCVRPYAAAAAAASPTYEILSELFGVETSRAEW